MSSYNNFPNTSTIYLRFIIIIDIIYLITTTPDNNEILFVWGLRKHQGQSLYNISW